MAEIELRQVAKKFGESWAVKPMDLTIRSGEFVALRERDATLFKHGADL